MEKKPTLAPVKFKGKPSKTGPEHVFHIPRLLINNGYIDPKKTYEITLRDITGELKKNEGNDDQ
jgi:hypothetical protein